MLAGCRRCLDKTIKPWCNMSSWPKGDSKALAAVQIADDAFFTPRIIRMVRTGVTSNQPPTSKSWPRTTIAAAGLCSIAVYWQALEQDVVNDYIDVYRRFLGKPSSRPIAAA